MNAANGNNSFIKTAIVSVLLLAVAYYIIGQRYLWVLFAGLVALENYRAMKGAQSGLVLDDSPKLTPVFKVLIGIYVAVCIGFIFYFQYMSPLDGDVVEIALPTPLYEQVLRNPLGQDAILRHQKYAGADGFVGLWTINRYFHTVPFIFQAFVSPLDSIYMSGGFFVALMAVLYTYLFSCMVSGSGKPFSVQFLLAALILSPLIQAGGYSWIMAVVDPMLVSTFAYTKSLVFVVVLFLPFFIAWFHDRKVNDGPLFYVLMISLAAYTAYNMLSGPIACVIFSFILLSGFLSNFRKNKDMGFFMRLFRSVLEIPRYYIILSIVTVAVAMFTRYLGGFNAESHVKQVPLAYRYSRLPIGLREHFSSKGLWLLSLMMLVNVVVAYTRRKDRVARKLLFFFWWAMAFCTLYTLMLPVGGYRFYRPNIIRRDLFSPVIITFVFFYVLSAYHLLRSADMKYRKLFVAVTIIPLLHYGAANFRNLPDNSCERAAVAQIAASKEKIVKVASDCDVFAWWNITDYRKSAGITSMMRTWNIIHEEKYFYQDSASAWTPKQ